jgi:anthranilate 1,2-dioxygenase small subunit
MNMELEHRINRFILRTAALVDGDKLEGWLDCFHAESSYVVLPRENLEAGYAIGLMRCDNKPQLVDRISVLRHASKFNPHWDRHIVGGTLVEQIDGVVKASTSFMVVQTQLNGPSTLFCSGSYEDELDVTDQILLRKRVVVLDTFTVSNCLATPL